MQILRGPKRAVASVDFSPDGRRLAVADGNDAVRVYDLLSGAATLAVVPDPPTYAGAAVRFAPDGGKLVALLGSRLAVWDAADGRVLHTLLGTAARGVADTGRTADGRLLAMLDNHEIAAWDESTWERLAPVARLGDRSYWLNRFAVEPGGARLALSGGELIDLRSGAACGRWGGDHWGGAALTWCPGRAAVALREYGPCVRVYDPDAAALVATLTPRTPKHATGLAFTPGGESLITVNNDGVARVYDTRTWRERQAFDWKAGALRCVAVSPDGTQAAAGGGDGKRGKVVVWDLE